MYCVCTHMRHVRYTQKRYTPDISTPDMTGSSVLEVIIIYCSIHCIAMVDKLYQAFTKHIL